MPNKLSQFWQELKRRKVIKVITMYAASAFIILEAVDIIFPRWGLPDWSVNLVILLLILGFIVAAVLSWIFDITPEGITKTGSAKEARIVIYPNSEQRKLRVSDIAVGILLIVVVILVYPKIFDKDEFRSIRDEDGKISVAIMPFENLTGDTTLDFFQRGLSTIIINELGTCEELTVLDDRTMYEVLENSNKIYAASSIPFQEREAALKVDAGIYVIGNYQGSGSSFRIIVNIIDTGTGEVIFGGNVEGDLKNNYLNLADSLSNLILSRLEIKLLQDNVDYDLREAFTNSSEAYEYYIAGVNSIAVLEFDIAIDYLERALAIDTSFTFAAFYLAWAYNYNFEDELAKIWTRKAYLLKDNLPFKYQLWLELWKSCYYDKDLDNVIYYCEQLERSDIKSRFLWFDLGATFSGIPVEYGKLENAIAAFEKVMEISLDWGGHWTYLDYYLWFGDVYHLSGKHEEENSIYNIGLEIFPRNQYILKRQAICALTRDDIYKEDYLEDYSQRLNELGLPQSEIEFNLGQVYREAGYIDQAETHFRKACNLENQNLLYVRFYAMHLIEYDINVDEGMELINRALEKNPENKNLKAHLLKAKGWGDYKLGNYESALQSLKEAVDLFYFFDPETNAYIQECVRAQNQDS